LAWAVDSIHPTSLNQPKIHRSWRRSLRHRRRQGCRVRRSHKQPGAPSCGCAQLLIPDSHLCSSRTSPFSGLLLSGPVRFSRLPSAGPVRQIALQRVASTYLMVSPGQIYRGRAVQGCAERPGRRSDSRGVGCTLKRRSRTGLASLNSPLPDSEFASLSVARRRSMD
jgi:hypothetical protein